ncbi:MAG: hypothetical protein ACLVO2_10270 [Clostridia bacterium]
MFCPWPFAVYGCVIRKNDSQKNMAEGRMQQIKLHLVFCFFA